LERVSHNHVLERTRNTAPLSTDVGRETMKQILQSLRNWNRRRIYRPGRVISRFVARDVKREVEVVSADQIDDGIIIGRVRTNNVLYVAKGLTEKAGFGEAETLEIATLWNWSGQPWGGLPDGTSIVKDNRD
jgi:hypothetical protein